MCKIKERCIILGKICEVFTKEYKKETEYREFMENILHSFGLNNKSEDIEEKVKRLVNKSFVSDFKVSIGEYN